MKYNFIILGIGLLVLTYTAIFNPNPFVFDERLFPPNVELMEKYGFGKKFLLEMYDQAPGPLYEFVHLPLKPLTKLTPQGLRIVNISLFMIVILILILIYKKAYQYDNPKAIFAALHIMAIQTLWQVTGLALTEIPAMVFATLAFYLLWQLIEMPPGTAWKRVLMLSVLCGITLGFAILGRTPYLVLLASVFAVLLSQKYIQKTETHLALKYLPYAIIALAMIVPIFVIWGGMVPPMQPRVDGAIKPWHGILSLAYTGIIALIINPYWFIINKKILITLAVVFTGALIVNFITSEYIYAPMSVTVQAIFGTNFLNAYVKLVSPLLATAGIYFLICCFYRGFENLNNIPYLLALLTTLAILATSAKISHQFSSRYCAQAAPFMVIVFTNIEQKDNWKWIRLIVGMTLGFLSLNTYAHII